MTINEFRNNHCGRGGSTHHLHHYNLWGWTRFDGWL